MYQGKYVFVQLMELVSRYEFDKCVSRYQGNKTIQTIMPILSPSKKHSDLSVHLLSIHLPWRNRNQRKGEDENVFCIKEMNKKQDKYPIRNKAPQDADTQIQNIINNRPFDR
ncbi:MAG: hypothetical protein ACI85O_002974 [Saprospiraceae bacterium]|jgi:hypothetical protein